MMVMMGSKERLSPAWTKDQEVTSHPPDQGDPSYVYTERPLWVRKEGDAKP